MFRNWFDRKSQASPVANTKREDPSLASSPHGTTIPGSSSQQTTASSTSSGSKLARRLHLPSLLSEKGLIYDLDDPWCVPLALDMDDEASAPGIASKPSRLAAVNTNPEGGSGKELSASPRAAVTVTPKFTTTVEGSAAAASPRAAAASSPRADAKTSTSPTAAQREVH